MNYKFGPWEFDGRDIDLIVELAIAWSTCSNAKIDRRHFNRKEVLDYAERYKLVQRGEDIIRYNIETQQNELAWFIDDPNRFYVGQARTLRFDLILPQEALWRLVRPIIEDHSGRSIIKDKRWRRHCGIYPQKDDNGIDLIFAILCELDKWHYIRFQAAGDIWDIRTTEDRAIRSES